MGERRKPGRPALPEGERRSVKRTYTLTQAQALVLRWESEDQGVPEGELVYGWLSGILAASAMSKSMRLTKKAKGDDDV